jgi:hypothetical protein
MGDRSEASGSLHLPQSRAIHEIAQRWIGKYERHRLQALSDLKKRLEQRS